MIAQWDSYMVWLCLIRGELLIPRIRIMVVILSIYFGKISDYNGFGGVSVGSVNML